MMSYRNAHWAANGNIDCEIDHPVFGWIPFTASANDTEPFARELFAILEAQGLDPFVPPPEPDPLEVERAGMTCSRFQAKAALMQAGLYDQIEGYLLTNGTAFEKLAWTEANVFTRDSPMIAAIGQLFQLTDTAIDDLFRAAMTVRA